MNNSKSSWSTHCSVDSTGLRASHRSWTNGRHHCLRSISDLQADFQCKRRAASTKPCKLPSAEPRCLRTLVELTQEFQQQREEIDGPRVYSVVDMLGVLAALAPSLQAKRRATGGLTSKKVTVDADGRIQCEVAAGPPGLELVEKAQSALPEVSTAGESAAAVAADPAEKAKGLLQECPSTDASTTPSEVDGSMHSDCESDSGVRCPLPELGISDTRRLGPLIRGGDSNGEVSDTSYEQWDVKAWGVNDGALEEAWNACHSAFDNWDVTAEPFHHWDSSCEGAFEPWDANIAVSEQHWDAVEHWNANFSHPQPDQWSDGQCIYQNFEESHSGVYSEGSWPMTGGVSTDSEVTNEWPYDPMAPCAAYHCGEQNVYSVQWG